MDFIESAITDPSTSRRHKIPIVSISAKFNIHSESGGELSSEDKESALKVIGNIINTSIKLKMLNGED